MIDEPKGLIFDIQGFSVHDGPSGRTLIFLKGCPLQCFWCANPEGQKGYPEIMYRRSQCLGENYTCIDACHSSAITTNGERPMSKGENIRIDREKCATCKTYDCVSSCYKNVLALAGTYYTVEKLFGRILKDQPFWGPGGGITLGGGEPMRQHQFIASFLQKCHNSYISTAIETCGYASWESYEKVIDNLDWVFFDIKHMDPEMHKKGTGVSNELILENARRISASRCRMIVRIPVIAGYNDTKENISATAKFLREIDQSELNILPYHGLGESKYQQLDMDYGAKHLKPPSAKEINDIKKIFESYSLQCYVGGDTPY